MEKQRPDGLHATCSASDFLVVNLHVEGSSAWHSVLRHFKSIVLSACEHLSLDDHVELKYVEEHLFLAGLRFFSERQISVLCADQKVLNCIKQRASSAQLAREGCTKLS